jgi:TolB-like protein/Tfp pilus assembly protein PilF
MGAASTMLCSVCGESLSAKGVCLACLLRAGLDESEQPVAPDVSSTFDDFEIERSEDGSLWELGRGGMGVTYRATERTLNRSVALKVIDTHGSEAVRERFLREARAAAALRHPNVAGVFRFGAMASGDRCYCAMELVEGETLEALVRRDGPLKAETALEIAIQVTRALIAAAERGLVHRDLKPANIMLTPSENAPAKLEVKVIDFGLAKAASAGAGEMELTRGEFVGTPAFASPEQFAGGVIDARTDIYALGVTLWYALTGRLPSAGRSIEEIRENQSQQQLPLEELHGAPRRVIALLRSCLAVNPAGRPTSARVLMTALESCQAQTRPRGWDKRVLLAAVVLGLGIAGFMFWHSRKGDAAFSIAVPEKSIAVLPFENLSDEKQNAYFTEGVQDEILTRLAAVRDLKVISRTSTAKYKSRPDNLKKVAQELGVSTILEGSVQKAGGKVRIIVQLIDARTDTHLWAKTYDRDLKDVFAVESEVSQEIGDTLRIQLSPAQSGVRARAPTQDTEAYDLFLRGEYEFHQAGISVDAGAAADRADAFYRRALARDPNFVAPAAQLARSRLYRHWYVAPLAPGELDEVKSIIDRTLTLAPNSPEAHLALGLFYYWGHREYEMALAEFKRTLELQPNNVDARAYCAWIYRRRGEWERSLADSQRAQELDPRDASIPQNIGVTYLALRQWKEAEQAELRALALDPQNTVAAVILVNARLCATGDANSARQALYDFPEAIKSLTTTLYGRRGISSGGEVAAVTGIWVYLDIIERHFPDAFRAFEKAAGNDERGRLQLLAGRVALRVLAGDAEPAKTMGEEALPLLEAKLSESPDDTFAITELSWVYLAVGRTADALRLSRKAADLISIEKDALDGAIFQNGLAQIEARAGAPEEAIKRLRRLLSIPGGHRLSMARLKNDPVWDPIRNRPDFHELLLGSEQIGPIKTSTSQRPGEDEVLSGPPEKSIAVLPFENLSRDPDNAFFTDGMQDEILTDLARIAELKVISRTSVMQYKTGAKRNLRQIGNELGVAHVVEGSVQRAGNRVRVNAQLIDARTDAHLWAQTYDRDLADVFAIQSEIAKAIADQLQAKLSPNEKSEIEQPPTTDVTAFDFYSHAKNLLLNASGSSTGKPDLLLAADLLNQAVARDPSFFEAYCQLAYAHASLYFFDFDHTPSRLAAAEAAVQRAADLRPDAGETHLARARTLYWGHSDYDGALAELEIARQRLPGDNWVFSLKGYIERRQARWEESLHDLERAIAFDPRNILTLQQTARSYSLLHRYAESKALLARVLSFEPNDPVTKVLHAFTELDANANARSVLEVIDEIRRTNPAGVPIVANNWLICSLAERDIAAANNALAACAGNPILLGTNENMIFPRSFAEGMIARTNHDEDKARPAFAVAQAEQEKIVQAHPNYGPALCVLGVIDAGLGRKEQALAEGRRAVELVRADKDVLLGATMSKYLAVIAAWVGDADLACNQLAMLIRDPSGVSYGQLKLMPFWDPLRGDSRFEKILLEAKQSGGRRSEPITAPDKSIAVLPFENLSEEKANEYFATGIQDEILTRLAAVRDLKVISRTSTAKYKSRPDNLKKIAEELGVSTILEGSVQKADDKVRINVQLISAASDSHLWAETFDRKLTDIFSVESEVAKAIVDRLQAKLTGEERQVIAAKPTQNPEAYDAYLRGLAYSLKTANTTANTLSAQKYLKEAVRLDPKFALAWALLSYVDGVGYRTEFLQPTEALREETRQAAETALGLQPNLGEAVLAKGFYHYACLRDYETALRYFEAARPLLPNSSRIPELLAYVTRRQGQWDKSDSYFNEAERLDPRNVSLLTQHALSDKDRRRFPEASRKLDQILNITPDDVDTIIEKTVIAQAVGDLPRASAMLAPLHLQANNPNALETQIYQAILERQPAPIIGRLKEILAKPDPALGSTNGELRFWLGWAQEVSGDPSAARETWVQARRELESFLKEQPKDPILLGNLALTEAGLGDKAAAFARTDEAIAARPMESDAVSGPRPLEILSRVAAQLGETDRALAALQKIMTTAYSGALGPGAPLTPALLRLDPMFDKLRGDARFEELCKDKQP